MSLLARCLTCPHRSIDRCRKSHRHIRVMDARGEPCPLGATLRIDGTSAGVLDQIRTARPDLSIIENEPNT